MKFVPTPMSARPSYAEAWQIAKAIRPRFAEYMTQYDTKKYWPVVYESFPPDFMFQLSKVEFENLKSQIVTSNWGGLRRAAPVSSRNGLNGAKRLNDWNDWNGCSFIYRVSIVRVEHDHEARTRLFIFRLSETGHIGNMP